MDVPVPPVATDVPVPPQDRRPHTTDLRHIALGPKGFRVSRKRKLDEQEEQVRSLGGSAGTLRASARSSREAAAVPAPGGTGGGGRGGAGRQPARGGHRRQARKAQHLGPGPGAPRGRAAACPAAALPA